MSIRLKTIIAISSAFIVLMGALVFSASKVVLESFKKLELEDTSRKVEQVKSAFQDNFDKLSSTAGDWATWTATWDFIEKLDKKYIDENLYLGGLKTINVTLMLFYDRTGRMRYGKHYDFAEEKEKEIPPEIIKKISSNSELLSDTAMDQGRSGIFFFSTGAWMFALKPILQNEGKGPCRGTLVIGRPIDSAETARLSEITHLSFSALPVNAKTSERYAAEISA
jgi:sensor domain CHASE-containing protein